MKTKKAKRIMFVGIAAVAVIALIIGATYGAGEEYAAEYTQKEAGDEDVFKEKVDSLFEKMADNVIYYTKETERADDPEEELQAIRKLDEEIYADTKTFDSLDVPFTYKQEMQDISIYLSEVQLACSETIVLYGDGEHEKAYGHIQTIIDKFAEAQVAKNKMFGSE